MTITFSTPNMYYSCTSAFDQIYTTGVPDNWSLDGLVTVMWATPEGPVIVPDGTYTITQTGNLDLALSYPPAWQWPDLTSIGNPLRELRSDLGIVVLDENQNIVTWVGDSGTLGPGQNWNVTCNPMATLGDRVWYDQDRDGIQDVSERGYNGATVDVFGNPHCTGAPSASVVTGASGADGAYSFPNLVFGNYCLQINNIPDGWQISPSDQGDGTNDSRANASAQIPNIHLTSDDLNEDFGIFVTGTLGGAARCISTGVGLANLTVELYKDFDGDGIADGPVVATAATDPTGSYQFTDLEVALRGEPVKVTQYLVRVDTEDTALGICAIPTGPTSYLPLLESNSPSNLDLDFQFKEPVGSIGDTVWDDQNGNGAQDSGELGLPNVTVDLATPGADGICGNADDAPFTSTVTDADGAYLFAELPAGAYCVDPIEMTVPAGYDLKTNNDPLTISLGLGEDFVDADFGYQLLVCALGIDVKCLVAANAQRVACTDAIVATTLRYIGPDVLDAVVEIDPDTSPTVVYPNIELISGETILQMPAESDFSINAQPEAQALGPKIEIRINGVGEVLHASCSSPYVAGEPAPLDDPKGTPSVNWVVESFVDKDSTDVVSAMPPTPLDACIAATSDMSDGAEITYIYNFTNSGEPLARVAITDTLVGDVAGPLSLASGATQTLLKVAPVAASITNTVFAYNVLASGATCPNPAAQDAVTVTVEEPVASCEGGTTELTFQYQGTAAATVTVYDEDNNSAPDTLLFEQVVQPGGQFTIKPRPGQGAFSPDISIYVNGQFHARIKTDCSQPIGPNAVYGDFALVAGRSKDSGRMRPLDACAVQPAESLEFAVNKLQWTVKNAGEVNLEVRRVTLAWPEEFGNLLDMQVNGAFWTGQRAPSSAVIEDGWVGSSDSRTIAPGDTRTLEFMFEQDVGLVGEGTIAMEFTTGCTARVSFAAPAAGSDFACVKSIDALTMIWDGPVPVNVTAWKGAVGSSRLGTVGDVAPGDAVTFAGFAGSPDEIFWEIFNAATGSKLGESSFHLACSDEAMNGPEDCGKRQGNGKFDDASLINGWILEGLSDTQTKLNCTTGEVDAPDGGNLPDGGEVPDEGDTTGEVIPERYPLYLPNLSR